jgi:hypothetical protein
MHSSNRFDKNIQFLITANYRRMMSFEQAAFLTNETAFKEFYMAKAEESELYMKQLQLILDVQLTDAGLDELLGKLQGSAYFPDIVGGKANAGQVLASVKLVEKSIAQWYKSTLKEIADLPKGIIEIVEGQYKSLGRAKLQLESL